MNKTEKLQGVRKRNTEAEFSLVKGNMKTENILKLSIKGGYVTNLRKMCQRKMMRGIKWESKSWIEPCIVQANCEYFRAVNGRKRYK